MNIFNKNTNYDFLRGDIINKTVKTVITVTLFSCVERFVGFLYRIFLSRNIGAELLGVYQITLSVVGVLVTLSASGIPITVSRLMIKERSNGNAKGEKDVVSAGILSSLMLSLPITLLMYVFRDKLSFIFADERCYDLLLVILPGVVITSVYSVIRGYFWGNKNFLTYSVIELSEEIIMAVCGVIAVKTLHDGWLQTLGVAKSVTVSYVFSFIASTAVFIAKSGKPTNPLRKIKPLLKSASPITAVRTLTSFLGSIVAILLPERLIFYGIEKSLALKAYGELSGMALPLLFIPSTVIGSIALVIVPKLSESYYKKDLKTLKTAIERSLDYSQIVAALIIPVFFSCGCEIGKIVYASESAGKYLSVSAIIMLPMSLSMITNSVLNSLNLEKRTLLHFVAGAASMILTVLFATKFISEYSLCLGYLVSYLLTAVLNFRLLGRITGEVKTYVKKIIVYFIAICLSGAFGYFLHGILYGKLTDFVMTLTVAFSVIVFETVFIEICGAFDFKKILNPAY